MVKAVILAAGKGTRMGDLTDEIPKPMLPVEGRPILEHIITGLREAGITEFCLITGWKAEVIESHFGNGADLGVGISYVRQEVQDGTGKAPELAKEFVGDDPFLLTYGDILVKPETYAQMIGRWAEGAFAGLVTVTGSEDVTKGGLFFFDAAFSLKYLVETSGGGLAEGGRAGLVQRGHLHFSTGALRPHCAVGKITARRVRADRRAHGAVGGRQHARGVGDRGSLGGCARSRGARRPAIHRRTSLN